MSGICTACREEVDESHFETVDTERGERTKCKDLGKFATMNHKNSVSGEVLIDSREKHYIQMCEYLAEYLPEDVYFNVPEGGLKNGADYILRNEAELAIQRKSIGDFIGSMNNGIKETMHKLRTNYQHSALLVEGDWQISGSYVAVRRGRKLVQTGLSFKSMHNFILSQQLRGTFYIRTNSLRETAMVLANWHSYLDGSISPSTNIEDPRAIFSQFPGIGPKLSEKICDYFGSPFYAFNQFPEGWDRVDGIGPATVDRCEEWLRGEEH